MPIPVVLELRPEPTELIVRLSKEERYHLVQRYHDGESVMDICLAPNTFERLFFHKQRKAKSGVQKSHLDAFGH